MKYLIYSTLIFLSISCSKNDNCIDIRTAFVSDIISPNTTTVNTPTNINLKYNIVNDCGRFYELIETGNGLEREIEIKAKYTGCNCAEIFLTPTTNYQFTPQVAGNYTLKFKSSETEFTTINIVVN